MASQSTPAPAPKADSKVSPDGKLLPPNARPGECYARIYVRPTYETKEIRVLKREKSERIEVIPAKYKTVEERVMVAEETSKLVVVPATYKWVEERIMVKPATEKKVTVAAVYETKKERVIDKPAHTVWQKGYGAMQKIDETTGEIMCLVEIPATYKTITKRVVKTPAKTIVKKFPAVYKTIKRRVVDKAAHTKKIVIPAKYKTIKTIKLVRPIQEKRTPVPEQFSTYTKKVVTAKGHLQWRPILCQTNMTVDRIRAIQRALKKNGYNPGPVDGVIGPETMNAVNAYQKKNKLPIDKYLNIETVRSLGVRAGA